MKGKLKWRKENWEITQEDLDKHEPLYQTIRRHLETSLTA